MKKEEYDLFYFCNRQAKLIVILRKLHLVKELGHYAVVNPLTEKDEGGRLHCITRPFIFKIFNAILSFLIDEGGQKRMERLASAGVITVD